MNKQKISPAVEPANAPPQYKPNPPQRLLVFPSRRLLAGKSLVMGNPSLSNVEQQTLTIRITMATTTMTEIPCYDHYGINE